MHREQQQEVDLQQGVANCVEFRQSGSPNRHTLVGIVSGCDPWRRTQRRNRARSQSGGASLHFGLSQAAEYALTTAAAGSSQPCCSGA